MWLYFSTQKELVYQESRFQILVIGKEYNVCTYEKEAKFGHHSWKKIKGTNKGENFQIRANLDMDGPQKSYAFLVQLSVQLSPKVHRHWRNNIVLPRDQISKS